MPHFDQIEGNLAADPILRFLEDGTAVCNIRVLHTPRRRTREGEWVDGETLGVNVACWRLLAENVAELRRGDNVVVFCADDLSSYVFEDRAYLKVTATNVALSLRWHSATSNRVPRSVADGSARMHDGTVGAAPGSDDPWTVPAAEPLAA